MNLVHSELHGGREFGKLDSEPVKSRQHRRGTRQMTAVRSLLKIAPNNAYHFLGLIMMRCWIVACSVRQVSRQHEWLPHHDLGRLTRMPPATETPCTLKETKLEWHVESRQALIQLNSGQIMHRPRALADQAAELVEANIGGILLLKGAAHPIPTRHDRENQSFKAGAIIFIERTVDKDIVLAHFACA